MVQCNKEIKETCEFIVHGLLFVLYYKCIKEEGKHNPHDLAKRS